MVSIIRHNQYFATKYKDFLRFYGHTNLLKFLLRIAKSIIKLDLYESNKRGAKKS